MSIKSWLRNWIMSKDQIDSEQLAIVSRPNNHLEEEASHLTFAVIKAMNGRIVKVSSYKPQQRGSDWTHELYIVKDDEKITDVIARIMAIKSLEQ
jgi:hypothetical protein